jgi:hypothetical protein
MVLFTKILFNADSGVPSYSVTFAFASNGVEHPLSKKP